MSLNFFVFQEFCYQGKQINDVVADWGQGRLVLFFEMEVIIACLFVQREEKTDVKNRAPMAKSPSRQENMASKAQHDPYDSC